MGSIRWGLRLGVCLVLAIGVAGCQPLYGGRPEKLRNPEKKKKPPEAVEATTEIKYVDDCNADFRGDPGRTRPQPSLAVQLVGEGDTALQSSEKAKDPGAQVGLIKDSIDKYRNALLKDPYNVEATLKLAVAYDKVLRKGCAIAMLKRLAALSNNPKYTKEANRDIESVSDTGQWFKGYRKEAIAAVGR